MCPNPLTEDVQAERYRYQRQRDEREQAVSPTIAKLLVHRQSDQRQDCTKDGSENRRCCYGRRSVASEGVDEICVDDHEVQHLASAEEGCTDERCYPVGLSRVSGRYSAQQIAILPYTARSNRI